MTDTFRDGQMIGRTVGWMDAGLDGWTGGWMIDDWMDVLYRGRDGWRQNFYCMVCLCLCLCCAVTN